MSASKKIASAVLFAALCGVMAVFLSSPAHYAKSVLDGISLWAATVLPSVFPFLFFSALLTGLPPFSALCARAAPLAGKLFGISGAGGGAAFLAAVSGYPVGARSVADLKERGLISKRESFRLACLATTSGPMFLAGTVGSLMYGSIKAGLIMLSAHFCGVWGICLILRLFSRGAPSASPAAPAAKRENLLYDSLFGAVISVLCVGGFIALFYCVGQMIGDLFPFLFAGGTYAEGILRGLLEMTSGCAALSALHTPLSCALSCALVTFGGGCVLCQQAAYLTRAGVKILPFAAVKCAQAALAFLFCYALASAFPPF